MSQDKRFLYCEFDICNKRLLDFCFVCKQDGKYYCDEICAERNLEQSRKREVFLWL
jgi:hypothetical protein